MNNATQNTTVNDTINLSRRSAFFNSVGAAAAAVAIPLTAMAAGTAEAASVKNTGPVAHLSLIHI